MADPIQVNYAGQMHTFPPDASQQEIASALEQWESTPRTPTAMANKELSKQGLQVSGQEMNPRVQANKVPVEYEGGIGKGKLAGLTAGAARVPQEIGEAAYENYEKPITELPSTLLGMAKGAVTLPAVAGENIGNAVEAWRNNEPYTAGHEATSGALNTAGALSLAKPVSAGVSEIPNIMRPVGHNLPRIGAGVGLAGGAVEAMQGRPWGLAYLPYLGEKGGLAIQRLFNMEKPENFTVGKMKAGRGAMDAPSGNPAPIPPPTPAPVRGLIKPSGEEITNARIPPTPRSKPPETFTPPPRVEPPATLQEAPAIAKPSEDAVAQGIGYRNARQATERLGPKLWSQTYEKVTAPEATIESKGEAAFRAGQEEARRRNPPPPPITRPIASHEPTGFPPQEYKPVLSPQSKNRFYDSLEDQAIKQEMEGEQGPTSMVTGRKGGGVSILPNEATSLQGEGRRVELEKGRELASRNSIGTTKGTSQAQFRGIAAPTSYADQYAARPLPGASPAANRMVGHPVSQAERIAEQTPEAAERARKYAVDYLRKNPHVARAIEKAKK